MQKLTGLKKSNTSANHPENCSVKTLGNSKSTSCIKFKKVFFLRLLASLAKFCALLYKSTGESTSGPAKGPSKLYVALSCLPERIKTLIVTVMLGGIQHGQLLVNCPMVDGSFMTPDWFWMKIRLKIQSRMVEVCHDARHHFLL